MVRLLLLSLALFATVAAPASALDQAIAAPVGDDRIRALEAFFTERSERDGLNGAILIARNGKPIYRKYIGLADGEAGRLVDADTEFELASIGKLFTATAVLQLVERRKIGLDASFASYFPDFPYPAVTVRQLLSHSSGLSDQDMAGFVEAYAPKLAPQPFTMRELISAIAQAQRTMKLKPGERWWYSNLGFQLLALLVEKQSGEALPEYLDAHVFGPAGMRHSYIKTALVNRADTPNFAQNYAWPHRWSRERVRLEGVRGYYAETLYGNASVIATADDLLRFDTALRKGVLLRPETLDLAYAPQRLADGSPTFVWLGIGGMGDADNGLGWFRFRDESLGRIVWHTGGMPGCQTILMRNLDDGITVILLNNADSENLYKSALSAMRILAGLPPLDEPVSLARIYGATLVDQGAEAARARVDQLRTNSTQYRLTESDLNNLGYALMEDGRMRNALAAFHTMTDLFPRSSNAFNSYGEGLEKAGLLEPALQAFRRSLELDANNTDSTGALERVEAALKASRQR
ncbi:serine hydrolase [Sphingomonas cannabina]|uniref:serine hydrolase domain-containing protein n=1 Tax=Sphingomonas cannabina TaxID=2899123 RepID=UPI001F218017|nr:serine hydrolase domain-containing protein [Sphingomonas cannabina]UIJ44803.1 serine hydrolase [Sphingomonas cannabina]